MESSCRTGPTTRCHLAGLTVVPRKPAEPRGKCRDIKEFAGRHQEPRVLSFCGRA